MSLPLWVLAAALCVGPTLDPISGVEVTSEDRAWLPSGRDLSSVADTWLVQVVNQQVSGGGITRFDPVRLGFHGNSWTQTRFLLNGLEINDPAYSGSPLVELPFGAWDRIQFQYQTSARPGFHITFAPEGEKPRLQSKVRWGQPTGGGTWVPQGLMDREPATFHGATSTRRALSSALEGELHGGHRSRTWALQMGMEHYEHLHHYPTFRSDDASLLDDTASRSALVVGTGFSLGALPVQLVAAMQQHRRSHEGAEFRWPEAYTKSVRQRALVVQGTTHWGALTFKTGLGLARDDQERHGDDPLVRDLETEWMWLERPRLAQDVQRWRFDGDIRWRAPHRLGGVVDWELGARLQYSEVETTSDPSDVLRATTYERGETLAAQAVSLTQYEPSSARTQWWRSVRPEAAFSGEFEGVAWRGDIALVSASLGVPEEDLLRHTTVEAGLSLRRDLGDFELFGVARRAPEALTIEVARFLDPHSPSGSRYRWSDDNGDGLPSVDEAGALMNRTGGRYHDLASGLTHPTRNLFSLGMKTPRFGPFVFIITTHFRWLLNRYTVRYAPEGEPQYTSVAMEDPGGSHKLLTVYEREPGGEGEERYGLTNAARSDFYFGTELQLKTEGVSGWFLNLSASGYLSQGSGAFGSFPDRNDSGILHEISADPNARVNQRSRYDHDRAFGINLLGGVEVWRDLRAALALRYRDGEPMTRYFVTRLAQGAVPIMADERGAPIPRHTFHMTLDTRLSHGISLGDWRGTLSLDCLNLLGSGTELLEDIRSGPTWRKSLEMVPGRAVLVNLELSYQ